VWWQSLQRWRQKQALNRCRNDTVKQILTQGWQQQTFSANDPWQRIPWLAIDIETTSLSPQQGEIISLGWVAIDAGSVQLGSSQRWLIKPKQRVGDSATIHYLRDSDLTEGVTLSHGLLALVTALAGRVALFHNRQLDIAFLDRELRNLFSMPWCWPVVDTLLLEKNRLQHRSVPLQRNSLRLNECRRRYHLPDYPPHDASVDALACAELFIAWCKHAGGEGPKLKQCLNWSR